MVSRSSVLLSSFGNRESNSVSPKIIEVLIMEGIAILFFVFAYLIGVKGRMELIAGYNERTASQVKDKEGLKRLIARLCLLIGVGSAIMPVLTQFAHSYPQGMAFTTGGYGGFILGIIGMVVLQSRDYVS